MRRVTMATRDELVIAVRERYANSERGERIRILDEFVAVTGFHRKHAMPTMIAVAGDDEPSTNSYAASAAAGLSSVINRFFCKEPKWRSTGGSKMKAPKIQSNILAIRRSALIQYDMTY